MQEKESIMGVRCGQKNLSLGITVCHHLASLVMPDSDLKDGFFYPHLTPMKDSYNIMSWFMIGVCAVLPEPLLLVYNI